MEDNVSSEDVHLQLPSDTHSSSVVATDNQSHTEPAVDTTLNKSRQLDSAGSNHEEGSEGVTSIHNDTEKALEVSEANDESLPDRSHEHELHSEQKVIDRPLRESPVLDDRNLEQFSEVLLDSDSSSSNHEVPVDEVDKQCEKRVRFADELEGSHFNEGQSSPSHPHLTSSDEGNHPSVPVSPSLTSSHQPVSLHQHQVDELIQGVEYPAKYLGSTPILLSGIGAIKSARMHQAQQAVKLIKDPDNESRPQFEVGIKISTRSVKIVDIKANIDLMEHPLHTISYVADIDGVLVIMAHLGPVIDSNSEVTTPDGVGASLGSYTPKITCHVLDTDNARHVARVIGQAFTAAYKEFLKSTGVSEEALEEAEYTHILNAQSVPRDEVETLSDRSKLKKITMAKAKGDMLGIMVMEAGYGSAIPACVVVHLSRTGAAVKSGLLNVGDHIISINGVSLVGMTTKSCIEQIKKCRPLNVVRMVVCSVPAVVDITIVRPDLKYQLGFSVHEGMICSLIRGSIGERSGIRIGHRIIDINGTSTVNMSHQDVVHLLSCTVGDLQIRTMPDLMYKLLTGQVVPEYY